MLSSAPPAPLPHIIVVSAITFEGFKLRSSNLTHALFIQISRTSSIIDIVVPSKMAAAGHFVKNFKTKVLYRSESDFSDIQIGRSFCKKITKIKNGYQSEMARNAIESDFRTSKMVGHFFLNFYKNVTRVI